MRLNPFIYPSYFYIYFYIYRYLYTRCWFQICFIFIPIWDYLGKRSNLTNIIVQMGCNHHLVYIYIYISLYAIISIVYILVDFFWGGQPFPVQTVHKNSRKPSMLLEDGFEMADLRSCHKVGWKTLFFFQRMNKKGRVCCFCLNILYHPCMVYTPTWKP